jgi:hypothetical protein
VKIFQSECSLNKEIVVQKMELWIIIFWEKNYLSGWNENMISIDENDIWDEIYHCFKQSSISEIKFLMNSNQNKIFHHEFKISSLNKRYDKKDTILTLMIYFLNLFEWFISKYWNSFFLHVSTE